MTNDQNRMPANDHDETIGTKSQLNADPLGDSARDDDPERSTVSQNVERFPKISDSTSQSRVAPIIDREQSVDRIVVGGGGQLPPVRIATGAGDDPPPDPFDPARLQLPQNFDAMLGIKKVLLTVPVRKPANEWFVQTHPDPNYRLVTAVLELKEDKETYLVDPDLWSALSSESLFSPRAIFTTISRQGVVFMWPIRLPGPDGKIDPWNKSALEAAAMATGQWVRVQSNMDLKAYEVFQAPANLPQPQWPDHKFQDLLRAAFKDHHITTLDHPVLRRLRGEV